MDISDGNLSFTATMDTSSLDKSRDLLVKYFTDMGLSAEEAGRRADAAMKQIEDTVSQAMSSVETDAEAMEVLKGALEEIQEQMESMEEGEAKEFLGGIAEGIGDIVEQMQSAQGVEMPLDGLEEGYTSAREAMRQMREELIQMKMNGQENTEEYQRLLEKLGMLQDAMSDTQQATRGMASDTQNLDAVMGAAQLTAGGFSAIMGAMNLVGAGEDTKELAEAQKKLQSVMAITTGLMSVQNALQKQSNVMLGIARLKTIAQAKAEQIKNAATGKGVIATKAATVAQAAFNAVAAMNPYVLLAMAILTVVGALVAFTSGTKENNRQQESLNNELERQLSILNKLSGAYDTLYEDEKNKLKNNIELLKAQGASTEDIRKAEDKLDEFEKERLDKRKQGYAEVIDKEEEYEQKLKDLTKAIKTHAKNEEDFRARAAKINPNERGFNAPGVSNRQAYDNAVAMADKAKREREKAEQDLEAVQKTLETIHQINQDEETYNINKAKKDKTRDEEDKKRADEKAKAAVERRKQDLEEEKRYQDELQKARERAEDLELGTRSDNINTRVAKIELDYERQINDAKEKAKEAMQKGRLELAGQYERQVVALKKQQQQEINKLYAEEEEAQEQSLNEILDNYKGYDAKRRAIEETFAEDIKKLTEKRDEYDEYSAEWLVYNEAVTQAFEAQTDALTDLNLEYGKLNKLSKERDRLEKKIALLIQSEDYDDEEVENLRKLLAEVQKQIDEITEKTDGATEATKTLADAWKEAAKEISNANISEQLNAAGSFVEKWSSVEGTKGFAYLGKIIGSLGNPEELFNNVVDIFIDSYTSNIERVTEAKKRQMEVERMLTQAHYDEMNAAKRSMWGEDVLGTLENQLSLIEEVKRKTKEAYAEFYGYNVADLQWKVENLPNWADLIGQKPQEILDKTLGDISIKTKNSFLGISDEYKNLEDIAKETGIELYDEYENINSAFAEYVLDTYDTLSDEQRDFLKSAKQDSEAYAEAMEGIASYLESLFGNVADTLSEQIVDSFIEGGEAAIDFGKITSDVARNMAKDFVKNMLLTEVFGKYEQQMKDIMMSDNTMEDKQRLLLGYFATMQADAEQLQPAVQAYLQAMSQFFGASEDMNEAVMSGNLLQSASQDSVDLLNGQLNAIRVNQAMTTNRIDDVLLQLSGIRTDMNNFRGDSNRRLDQIIDNTSERGSLARAFGMA